MNINDFRLIIYLYLFVIIILTLEINFHPKTVENLSTRTIVIGVIIWPILMIKLIFEHFTKKISKFYKKMVEFRRKNRRLVSDIIFYIYLLIFSGLLLAAIFAKNGWYTVIALLMVFVPLCFYGINEPIQIDNDAEKLRQFKPKVYEPIKLWTNIDKSKSPQDIKVSKDIDVSKHLTSTED